MTESLTDPDAAVVNIERLDDYDPFWFDKDNLGYDQNDGLSWISVWVAQAKQDDDAESKY